MLFPLFLRIGPGAGYEFGQEVEGVTVEEFEQTGQLVINGVEVHTKGMCQFLGPFKGLYLWLHIPEYLCEDCSALLQFRIKILMDALQGQHIFHILDDDVLYLFAVTGFLGLHHVLYQLFYLHQNRLYPYHPPVGLLCLLTALADHVPFPLRLVQEVVVKVVPTHPLTLRV